MFLFFGPQPLQMQNQAQFFLKRCFLSGNYPSEAQFQKFFVQFSSHFSFQDSIFNPKEIQFSNQKKIIPVLSSEKIQ
jgi:hypothetical protein